MKTDLAPTPPKTIYLKDYKPYPFAIHALDMKFELFDDHTIVTATAQYERKSDKAKNVFLYGEDLELLSVEIDNQKITNYQQNETSLRIPCPKDRFTLTIKTKIYPHNNTRLEGLYMSGGNFCTQCEAEGFRRITYFPDRPDVLTIFTVRVEADKKYPILLSNGNKAEHGDLANNRHFTTWHDPFPKPCYLFALVAGDLTHIHDTYTTKSGLNVDLYIYVRPGDESQCDHAMRSLKAAMKWDEDTYGLEYELEIFNIVAVSDFNMGAMENTSLNIFNTALVLAAQETATDQDYGRVESVIAHEYFHNWSGNRVTCRDWFQLSLKEGLTVFRDQEFSADLNSRAVQRIDDVTHLRRMQFPEDAGPLSHPIRPDNYIEINNFYTMTVYEKGAEVIRMLHTLIGAENYRKGTDLYFSRHDGQAVTCDDFVACMQEASGVDLTQFKLWYSQSGTPQVQFKGTYDDENHAYTIELTQQTAPTSVQKVKKPLHMPILLGLLDKNGNEMIETMTLDLKNADQTFTINNINEKPTPSVLRNFSAPVKLQTQLNDDELAFLMQHDNDNFNRWEAGQQLALRTINAMIDNNNADSSCQNFVQKMGNILEDATSPNADHAFFARALTLPSLSFIGQNRAVADPTLAHNTVMPLTRAIKKTHRATLDKLYAALSPQNAQFEITPQALGRRALRNVIVAITSSNYGEGCAKRAKEHYQAANNMTDRIGALSVLTHMDQPQTREAFNDFYEMFKVYPLVIDKWFALQAASTTPNIFENIEKLSQHADFNIKNPNRVRALYASFAMNNPVMFHHESGKGYELLTDAITRLNAINPQIGSRLLTPLREWKRYPPDRQHKMRTALEQILQITDIAPDIYEIVSKSLNG